MVNQKKFGLRNKKRNTIIDTGKYYFHCKGQRRQPARNHFQRSPTQKILSLSTPWLWWGFKRMAKQFRYGVMFSQTPCLSLSILGVTSVAKLSAAWRKLRNCSIHGRCHCEMAPHCTASYLSLPRSWLSTSLTERNGVRKLRLLYLP